MMRDAMNAREEQRVDAVESARVGSEARDGDRVQLFETERGCK